MNVFHAFTNRSLLKNKARTLVTLIGIILSVSLLTAVIEGAYSAVRFLEKAEIERTGSYHGLCRNLSHEEALALTEDPAVRSIAYLRQVGWAEIGSGNEHKPYLSVKSASDHFTSLVSVHITSGRFPENENELLLPNHLSSNGGVFYKIGDEIHLTLGTRTSDGHTLTASNPYNKENGETLSDAFQRTYTVTGFYDRFSYDIEPFSEPGYTALTVGEAEGDNCVFFTLHHPQAFFSYISGHESLKSCDPHTDLLVLYGATGDSELTMVLKGFVCILVLLIAFGSISLIYNSFSISVSERTRQFGILKSIGATGSQLIRSVLYEASVLCLIAIPLGLIVGLTGIGITLFCLKDSFGIFLSEGVNVKMQLSVNALGLLWASMLSYLTVIVSALIPALRVSRLSAMDAIRQTKDVRIRPRSVRIFPLTKRLFGFEGMLAAKNFKRNKKRYRATVMSLFLSIVLFISAATFCAYLTNSVYTASAGQSLSDLQYTVSHGTNGVQALRLLKNAQGVDKIAFVYSQYMNAELSPKSLTSEYKDLLGLTGDPLPDTVGISAQFLFVDDDTYRAMLLQSGLDAEAFLNASPPLAAIVNETYVTYRNEDNKVRYTSFPMLGADSLPLACRTRLTPVPDGYRIHSETTDEDGNHITVLYPMNYTGKMGPDEASNENSPALILRESDKISKSFTIGGFLKEYPFFSHTKSGFTVFYPISALSSVSAAAENTFLTQSTIRVLAQDHQKAYDSMYRILTENGLSTAYLYNIAEEEESERMLVTAINVFAYGFIILISLIAVANVFNTVSTSITLRRREFAMLRSTGLTNAGFYRILIYECMIYGLRAIAFGLPASFAVAFGIYTVTRISFDTSFYVPLSAVVTAVSSVFIVVFLTMLYAIGKIRKANPIDALRTENL